MSDLDHQIIDAEEAARIVGASSAAVFRREVKAGKWPKQHKSTLGRKRPGWDKAAIQAAIATGSDLRDPLEQEREELRRGLDRGDHGSA